MCCQLSLVAVLPQCPGGRAALGQQALVFDEDLGAGCGVSDLSAGLAAASTPPRGCSTWTAAAHGLSAQGLRAEACPFVPVLGHGAAAELIPCTRVAGGLATVPVVAASPGHRWSWSRAFLAAVCITEDPLQGQIAGSFAAPSSEAARVPSAAGPLALSIVYNTALTLRPREEAQGEVLSVRRLQLEDEFHRLGVKLVGLQETKCRGPAYRSGEHFSMIASFASVGVGAGKAARGIRGGCEFWYHSPWTSTPGPCTSWSSKRTCSWLDLLLATCRFWRWCCMPRTR